MNQQLTFPFYDDALVDGRLSEYRWTKIKPDQWVRTTRIEKWTTESNCPCFGVSDDEPVLEHHSKEVIETWAVRLLPVFVSPDGYFVKFPYQFEKIDAIPQVP